MSVANDSMTSAIASVVRCRPSRMCNCCATWATARISAIGRSVSTSDRLERSRPPRHQVQGSDAPAARDQRQDQHRLETGGHQHVDVEQIDVRAADVVDQQRFQRSHHLPDRGAVDLEHDVRTRAVAALVLLDPRGEGLELLAGLGQQREPDPVARHQPGDPHRQRLERQRDVDRPGDDLQHRVLGLQLLDLIQGRAVRVLARVQPVGQGADAARRQHRERQHDHPPRHQEQQRRTVEPAAGDAPQRDLQDGESCHQPPDDAELEPTFVRHFAHGSKKSE